MNLLLSVDPGVHAIGAALFQDEVLVKAEYLTPQEGVYIGVSSEQSSEVYRLASALSLWTPVYPRVDVVIEVPQVYDRRHSKGDPNDLIDLAIVCGAIAGRFPGRLRLIKPREWGGQVPKEIKNDRVMKKLLPREVESIVFPRAKSKSHNVLDSVGLGLWALGRFR